MRRDAQSRGAAAIAQRLCQNCHGVTLPDLERVAQRKLNQARHALGAGDYAEIARAFHVRGHRVRKVGMVPDVEEVRREAQRLPLGQLEILDEREIPVLLERSAVDVAAQIRRNRSGNNSCRRSCKPPDSRPEPARA